MSYPTLEQYNEALQHPQLALVDPLFKTASVATTGLGLPLALCGGFALTYTVTASGSKFAVRCFHKQSNGLETRYGAISKRLKSLGSPYFIDFEFQPQGVRVNRHLYPVVKMAWASGSTLGEFVGARHSDAAALLRLDGSLQTLAAYLETQGIAHGDVQPGNVMVASDGGSVQLIDYDGMYLDELKPLGSAERGLRNFQHPARDEKTWDPRLDRFSFITLSIALRALAADPSLWSRYQADETSFLFKANDFAQPGQSRVFQELFARADLGTAAKGYAAICSAPYAQTPSLADFLASRNVPQVVIQVGTPATAAPVVYLSAFQVLSADSYAKCLPHVGDRVELIGRVLDVFQGQTKYGKPFVFLNFGDWHGNIVKVQIWSEGLQALETHPDGSWRGKWVSVVGLLEPPYRSGKYGYEHLGLTVTQTGQMHLIDQHEAKFRLGGSKAPVSTTSNADVLTAIGGRGAARYSVRSPGRTYTPTPAPRSAPPAPVQQAATPNEAILAKMRASQSAPPPLPPQPPAAAQKPVSPAAATGSGCLLAGVAALALGGAGAASIIELARALLS